MMNRNILCPTCAVEFEQKHGDGTQHPGEHVKYVKGLVKHNPCTKDRLTHCDHCDVLIPLATPCVAMTIYTDHGAQPYEPWEHENILQICSGCYDNITTGKKHP